MFRRAFFSQLLVLPMSARALSAKGSFVSELELHLCLDWSGSMYLDSQHHRIQRNGHLEALDDLGIRRRLLGAQPVVYVWLWAQLPLVEPLCCIHIRREADIAELRRVIESAGHGPAPAQDTYHSVIFDKLLQLPPLGARRIIDISTDEAPTQVSAQTYCGILRSQMCANTALNYGVDTTVNVIALNVPQAEHIYLREHVCTDEGFLIAAHSSGDYGPGIRKKLYTEVSLDDRRSKNAS